MCRYTAVLLLSLLPGQLAWAQSKAPIPVLARGVGVAPGAIVCLNLQAVQLVFSLYTQHWEDATQDRLTRGQSQLIRGTSAAAPNPGAWGCALVEPGTWMLMEPGDMVPIVSAELPDGQKVRGVTLPGMIVLVK